MVTPSTQLSAFPPRPTVGVALGSGAARGWAHIGVLQELAEVGIEPDVVCGSSIGAAVGGAYVAGHLETLEAWARRLDRRALWRYLDPRLASGGGFLEGRRLLEYFHTQIGERAIEELDKPFAAVATDLANGREVWFRSGPLLDAVRASIAIPGLFVPVKLDGRWLVDGGLANPVPVSLCRVLGADVVIAVNLNGDLLGRRSGFAHETSENAEATWLSRWSGKNRKNRKNRAISKWLVSSQAVPGLFDVLSSSINIMQDRLTRSRMAGDPADAVLVPRLADMGLLEFERAAEVIAEGRACVRRALPVLEHALGSAGRPLGR